MDMNIIDTSILYPTRASIQLPHQIPLLPDELQYSYLIRLACEHGYDKINNFLMDYSPAESRKKWERYRTIPYDCSQHDLDLGFLLDGDNFFLCTSIYPGLYPLMTPGVAARYVNSFWEMRPEARSGGVSHVSLIEHLKRCPECWRQDFLLYGTTYFHRAHNMPGVTVCAEHGCRLEYYTGKQGLEIIEDSYVKVEALPNAKRYAVFCKDMLDLDIQSSVFDTAATVRKKLMSDYGINGKNKIKDFPFEPWLKPYFERFDSTISFLYNCRGNHKDYKGLMAILLILFKKASIFEKEITVSFPKKILDDKCLAQNLTLVSEYKNSLVEVMCGNCGGYFNATAHGIITGLGCPYCNASLSKDEFYRKQLITAFPSYIPLTEIETLGSVVTVQDKRTGETSDVVFDTFLNFGNYTQNSYLPLIGSVRHGAKGFSDFNAEIKKHSDFQLVGNYMRKDQHMLCLMHTTCGNTFNVALWDFRRKPFCRYCKPGKNKTTEEIFKMKIEKEGSGEFRLVGKFKGQNKCVTIMHCKTRKKIRGKPKHIIDIIRRINSYPQGIDKKRLDRSECKKAILERMDSWNDDIMFSAEFADICDGRYFASFLSQMKKKGEIVGITDGVFCRHDGPFNALDVIMAKYVTRHNLTIGLDIGPGYASSLGLIQWPDQTVVVGHSNTGKVEGPEERKAMGCSYLVYYSPKIITDENSSVTKLLFFLNHALATRTISEVEQCICAISTYITNNQIPKDAFSGYIGMFNSNVVEIISDVYAGAYEQKKKGGI